MVGRRRDALEQTGELLQSPWAAFDGDLADDRAIPSIVRRILDKFPRIDALVNNAGIAPSLPVEAHTPEIVRTTFAVNAIGPTNLIAALWPTFVNQRSGRIVNVSSVAARDPFPGFLAYAPAKAAVNMLATLCATEGAAHGIKAFGVAPGATETAMLRAIFSEADIPPDRVLKPEDVARVIVACLVGDRDDQNGCTMYIPSP